MIIPMPANIIGSIIVTIRAPMMESDSIWLFIADVDINIDIDFDKSESVRFLTGNSFIAFPLELIQDRYFNKNR